MRIRRLPSRRGAGSAWLSTDPLPGVTHRACESDHCLVTYHGEPDPDLTAEEEVMLEIGWLDLWHAEREASGDRGGDDD